MPAAENSSSIKMAAARLVHQLPESASWDDLIYEILVRQNIESGLADLQDGGKQDHASVCEEFQVVTHST